MYVFILCLLFKCFINSCEVKGVTICIQETKLDRCDSYLCRSLWGGSEVEWLFRESVGNSGGLLCLWCKDTFVLQKYFVGNSYLGVKGVWGQTTTPCFIFNVFSTCSLAGKRALWEKLRGIRANNLNFPWCVVGDFNTIRCPSERRGVSSQFASGEMLDFDEFIDNMGLNDLPLIGRKFTWHRPNGKCISRLDRFLISDEWLSVWQDLAQWSMDRIVSDHNAIVLKPSYKDWGLEPFRVLNYWLQCMDFHMLFKEKWEALNVSG